VAKTKFHWMFLISALAIGIGCTQTPSPQLEPNPDYSPPNPPTPRLEMFPSNALLEPGATQEFEVRLIASDGRDLGPANPATTTLVNSNGAFAARWLEAGRVVVTAPAQNGLGVFGVRSADQNITSGIASAEVATPLSGVIRDSAFTRPEFERVRVSDPNDPANPLLPFTLEEYVDAYAFSLDGAPQFPMRAPQTAAARVSPGQIVVGANAFGRVVRTVASRDGQVLFSVQQLMPNEAFTDFQRNWDFKPLIEAGLLKLSARGARAQNVGGARAQSWKPSCKLVKEFKLPGQPEDDPDENSAWYKRLFGAFDYKLEDWVFNTKEFTFDFDRGPRLVLNAGLRVSAGLKPITGEFGVKCNLDVQIAEIPMPGLVGMVVQGRLDFVPEFKATIKVDAEVFSLRSELSVDLVLEFSADQLVRRVAGDGFKLTVDPKFAVDAATIDGPTGMLEFKAAMYGPVRFMVYTNVYGLNGLVGLLKRWPWLADRIERQIIALLTKGGDITGGLKKACEGKGGKTVLERMTEGCLGNIQLNFGPGSEFKVTTYTLNQAWLDNKRSDASFKPLFLKLEGKTAGYLSDKLKFITDKLKVEQSWDILEERKAQTPINTLAQTVEDRAGKAKLKFEWTEAEAGEVHLGVRKDVVQGRNSLHGQKTAPAGGPVTYNPKECPADDSGLQADVVIFGELKFLGASFGKGWPMSADRKVRVCGKDSKLSAEPVVVRALVKQSGNFDFTVKNNGLERSPYWVKTSPPKGMKLEDSQGELEANASKAWSGSYTCPDKPGAWEGKAILRDFSGNITQEQQIPLILICQGSNDVWGDPHLITMDGLGYSFQGKGEFVLLNAPDAPVQIRFEPVNPFWPVTVPTRLAARVGKAVVEVAPGPMLRGRFTLQALVDGQSVDEALSNIGYVRLPNGGLLARLEGVVNGIGRTPMAVALVWPSSDPQADTFGIVVRSDASPGIASLHVSPSPTPAMAARTSGLLGNFDGQVGNDLAKRDGTTLEQPLTSERLYGEFAREWAVRTDERLFTDAVYPHDTNFPPPNSGLTPEARARAETVCGGIGDSFLREACINDVGFTNDNSFATTTSSLATERQTLGLPAIPVACLEEALAVRVQRLNCVAIKPVQR
jgi:hypothetical protein